MCFSAKKIVYIPYAFYHYIKYNASAITIKKISQKEVDGWIHAANMLKQFFLKENNSEYDKDIGYFLLLTKYNCIKYSQKELGMEYAKLYLEANKYRYYSINKVRTLQTKMGIFLISLNCISAFYYCQYIRRWLKAFLKV